MSEQAKPEGTSSALAEIARRQEQVTGAALAPAWYRRAAAAACGLITRMPRLVLLGLFAFALTVVTGAIWTALVVTNLRTTREVPWAVAPMAVLLWATWRYLTGAWGPGSTAATRRRLARATPVPPGVFLWSLLAGGLSLAALSGLWIVLSEMVRIPVDPLQDLSGYPLSTVIPLVIMASLVSSSAEEIGFRGYLQGPLEPRLGGAAAVAIMIAVIAPAHAITQGSLWPVVVFYLLADTTFGCLARLTGSILPGFVIHALGLAVFFAVIWPGDRSRGLISAGGPTMWFWIHAGLVLLAIPAILVFLQLAKHTARYRQAGPGSLCLTAAHAVREHVEREARLITESDIEPEQACSLPDRRCARPVPTRQAGARCGRARQARATSLLGKTGRTAVPAMVAGKDGMEAHRHVDARFFQES